MYSSSNSEIDILYQLLKVRFKSARQADINEYRLLEEMEALISILLSNIKTKNNMRRRIFIAWNNRCTASLILFIILFFFTFVQF